MNTNKMSITSLTTVELSAIGGGLNLKGIKKTFMNVAEDVNKALKVAAKDVGEALGIANKFADTSVNGIAKDFKEGQNEAKKEDL